MNGQDYSRSEVKWVGGYVMQDDVLNAWLTVKETIEYTARLRLPPTVSSQVFSLFRYFLSFFRLISKERSKICEKALEQMGLSHTKDTLVGSPLVKGISGIYFISSYIFIFISRARWRKKTFVRRDGTYYEPKVTFP